MHNARPSVPDLEIRIMQIDFHHAVTYVIARLAGFPPVEADVLAHSAQYVDDATKSGEVRFDNRMRFQRLSSAHRLLDYNNLSTLANCQAWVPFHFLPGNAGEPAPAAPPIYEEEVFIARCVCRPDSVVAQDMMRAVIERQDRPYALYRLGIAAHVYVDTWAHQGFVGFNHAVNNARRLVAQNDAHHEVGFVAKAKRAFGDAWNHAEGIVLGDVFPLGHGAVLSYPDRPYLRWSYTNGLGEDIVRDNPRDFDHAARRLYQQLRRYRDFAHDGDAVFTRTYDEPDALRTVAEMLAAIDDEDGGVRHATWLAAIAEGRFGFRDTVGYIDKGAGSWKAIALGIDDDIDGDTMQYALPYPAEFANSHWKLFHDALQAHRFFVLHELLPRYGLLAV